MPKRFCRSCLCARHFIHSLTMPGRMLLWRQSKSQILQLVLWRNKWCIFLLCLWNHYCMPVQQDIGFNEPQIWFAMPIFIWFIIAFKFRRTFCPMNTGLSSTAVTWRSKEMSSKRLHHSLRVCKAQKCVSSI